MEKIQLELSRIFGGLKDFAYHLITEDKCSPCLGRFYTDTNKAFKDRSNSYNAVLTNWSKSDENITLLFDLYSYDTPLRPEGHHAYFSWDLIIPPQKSIKMSINYDYNYDMQYTLNNSNHKPTTIWKGPFRGCGMYKIHLLMFKETTKLSELYLIQRLIR